MWSAKVSARQGGGPIYVHHFEGADAADLLSAINDGLDLSGATAVSIHLNAPGAEEIDEVDAEVAAPACSVERDRFAIMRAASKIAAERGPVQIGRVFPPEAA